MGNPTSHKFTVRFRAVDVKSFNLIKKGIKTIETRAATKKYRNLKAGDTLVVVCGKRRIEKKIRKVRYFKSIGSMLRAVPYKKVNPLFTSVAAAEKIYFGYPGYRGKIKKFGLLALYLK
jgi:ASC-1-like (ASCH) protein